VIQVLSREYWQSMNGCASRAPGRVGAAREWDGLLEGVLGGLARRGIPSHERLLIGA